MTSHQSISVDFITRYNRAGLAGFQRDMNTLSGSTTQAASKVGSAMTGFARFSTAAGTALMVGLGAALAVGIKASIDFEDAFAGVRKTVEASEGTFRVLAEDIRALALDIPIAVTELADIAALGGQLGLPAEKLIGFTDVVAKLGVTTNLSTEAAATGLARFVNVMGTSQDDFDNVASSLVELGNNFATTEEEILNFATRLSGVGSIVGLTEGDVLGLATAFTALGEPAERGSTALQRVFLGMETAIQETSAELFVFAETAGMTAQAFGTLFQEDPAAAFLAFLEGLSNISEEGGNVIGVLDDLGLSSQRTVGLLLKGASGFETVATAVDTGNQAYAENIALNEEAEKRFGTLRSQITLLGNQFKDFAITMGDKAAPAFEDFLGFLGGFFDILKENTGLVTAFGAAILLLATGKGIHLLMKAVGAMTSTFGAFRAQMAQSLLFGGWTQAMGFAVKGFAGALGLAALGVGAIATAFALNRSIYNEYHEKIVALADALDRFNDGTITATELQQTFADVLAQKTGIFDIPLDIEKFREDLLELDISASKILGLAVTDFRGFRDEVNSIIADIGTKAGLKPEQIAEIQRTLRVPTALGGVGMAPLNLQEMQRLENFVFVAREINVGARNLQREIDIQNREIAIGQTEMLNKILSGGFVPPSVLTDAALASKDILSGIIDREKYDAALDTIEEKSREFSDDFLKIWDETVQGFTDQLFDWETAWAEYEQAPVVNLAKLQDSLANWVADAQKQTDTRLHILQNYGRDEVAIWDALPDQLRAQLAAAWAKNPSLFGEAFDTILATDQALMDLLVTNLFADAPAIAAESLPAWEAFFNDELAPVLAEGAEVGSLKWSAGMSVGFDAFIEEVRAKDPIMADALTEMLRKAAGTTLNNLSTDELIDVVQIMASDLTTQEKLDKLTAMGLTWAQAVALGFAKIDGLMEHIAGEAATTVNRKFGGMMRVSSPSKVFEYFGKMSALGYEQGFMNGLQNMNFKPGQPVMKIEVPNAPVPVNGPSITIVNPQHKDDDVLDGIRRATTLVGLTRAAETTPGFA
jgi:TP901 family phage tail tape measure protein